MVNLAWRWVGYDISGRLADLMDSCTNSVDVRYPFCSDRRIVKWNKFESFSNSDINVL